MALTLSFSKGNLSPYHDMRIGKIPDNVDPDLMCNNCVMIDKLSAFDYDIESYTNAKFQPFIDNYNTKQTRDSRKKTKPYVEMLKEENEKLIKKAEENKKEGKKTSVKSGERMHEYAVNNVLRRCNGVRNENDRFIISGKPSGNHAIRKTCISELHDSQLLPDRMISDFAGHKDISTTQKYYIHSVTPLTDKAEVFAKVFSSKAV